MKKVQKKIHKSQDTVSPALKQEFRNLGVLIENNTHKIEVVAEQVGDILVRTTNLEMNVDTIKTGLSFVKNRLDGVDAKLDVVQSDVEIIKTASSVKWTSKILRRLLEGYLGLKSEY